MEYIQAAAPLAGRNGVMLWHILRMPSAGHCLRQRWSGCWCVLGPGFLGLGVSPPADWGVMVSDGERFSAWHPMLLPSLA
jgi:hypothetical protein